MRIKKGISVIVTVFNKEKFIEKTILCILKQMKKNYQLIIVNDGSTDNSSKLIKKIIKNRKFDIRYIKKKNSGPSISINIALKYVKYSHIKLVDGDDIIAPDALHYMFSEMEKLNLDLLYGHWEWVKNTFKYKFVKDTSQAQLFENAFNKFILSGWGGSSNLMVKTSSLKTVGGCDEKVFVQDYSLPLKIAGYHMKSKSNKKFRVGLTKKLICVGPLELEERVMNNNGQTLYDLSLATINFLETHPHINKKVVKKCKKKILSRCWYWQKKELGISYFSKNFLTYIKNKYFGVLPLTHIKLVVFETWRSNKNIKKFEIVEKNKKKILIYVGLDLLGDALLKLPALKFLKDCFPNSDITWFAGKGKSIFSNKLKPLSKNLIHNVQDKISYGSTFFDFFKKINFDHYDIVIDTQKRFLTTLLLKKIPTDLFISPSSNFLFSDIPLAAKSEKNLSLNLIQLIGLLSNKEFENYSLNKSKTKKIAICPGAAVKAKRWKLNNFLEVAKFLKTKRFDPIFILGPKEKEMRLSIQKTAGNFKIFESNDPLKTITFSKNCFFGLSNDTGCGHLISASGIPTLTIFGPTDAEKFLPIGNEKNAALSSQLNYKDKNINKITPVEVIEKISKWLT